MPDVPSKRSAVVSTDIATGVAVRSKTWLAAADTLNWALGQGDQLVPVFYPNISVAAGASIVLYFRVTPNGRGVVRYWTYRLAPVAGAWGSEFTYAEPLGVKSAATQNINFAYTNSTGVTQILTQLGCMEGTRRVLDYADGGVDQVTEQAREPIDARTNSSIGGLFTGVNKSQRRVSYMVRAKPAVKGGGAWQNATTTFAYIVKAGVILTRKVNYAVTTGPVTWHFYCSCSNQLYGGTIRITNVKTASATDLIVPGSAGLSTGFLWFDQATTDFECEDLTQASGQPAGTPAEFHIEFKSANAAGTFYVASAICEET